MAEKLTVGQLIYKISADVGELRADLKKAETEIKGMKTSMEQGATSAGKLENSFSKLGKAAIAFVGVFAAGKLKTYLTEAMDLARGQVEAQVLLTNTIKTTVGATDEQAAALLNQASALEKVGVVGKEAIIGGQARLAQFDLQTESIEKLTPAILNYVVAERGANATRQDVEARTNSLAQALQGNFKSLTQVGFVLDEATKEYIANGTEAERVEAIVSVLDSTYAGMNETLRESLGATFDVQQMMRDLKTEVGNQLSPTVQALSKDFIDLANRFVGAEGRSFSFGEALYSTYQALKGVINVLIASGKAFQAFIGVIASGGAATIINYVRDIFGAFKNIGTVVNESGKALKQFFSGDFDGAVNTSKNLQKTMFQNTISGFKGIKDTFADYSASIMTSLNAAADNFNEAKTRSNFQSLADMASKATSNVKQLGEGFNDSSGGAGKAGKAVEDTEKKIESLRKEMEKSAKEFESYIDGFEKAITSSAKARDQIAENMVSATNSYADSLAKTLSETESTLAGIALSAEQNIEKLKKDLSETDRSDGKRMSELREQIREQEAVLESRVGFEERQAERIASIRENLERAGIDIVQTGLDGVLQVRSIEEQIEEQRRLAGLNSFELFEEQQAKMLETLTNDFIVEVGMLNEKYALQVQLESDLTEHIRSEKEKRKEVEANLTNFIKNEDAKKADYEKNFTAIVAEENKKRSQLTQDWAVETVARYGQVADSVRNMLSAATQNSGLGNIGSISPFKPSALASASQSAVNQNNTTTINSPVTINGAGFRGGMTADELSAIMGFNLNKYVK